ncbi:MAG: 4Fe-4S binding protein [Desulfobacteraceae bacterium]|nr:4Fe-4S binding protein [Desulfobacteraceae bacterium]
MIKIDASKCNRDDLCSLECSYGFMFNKDDDGYPVIDKDLYEKYCIGCQHCIAVCPTGAISDAGYSQEDLERVDRKQAVPATVAAHHLKTRRSIRTFKDKPVPEEAIREFMEITRWSPTASNSQQLKWLVVKEKENISQLAALVIDWIKGMKAYPEIIEQWDAGNDIILRRAPHLAIVTAPKEYFWGYVDAATAISHLELFAPTVGLGTCWAGYFTRCASQFKPLTDSLELGPEQIVTGALMFGYPSHRFKAIPARNEVKLKFI